MLAESNPSSPGAMSRLHGLEAQTWTLPVGAGEHHVPACSSY